ncbi:MAG: panC [Pseudonocardiales bacterium]|nr:panC [Pseudonocardiales bacterium]
MTDVVHTRAQFVAARAALPGPVGVVLTMGALHDGHRALIAAARAHCASVVVTVFVNPLQFGPNEDLAKYPRTTEADIALCTDAGADVLWMPGVEDVYAAGPVQVTVAPGPVAALLEGAVRPGHFDGVLTVVAKFLLLTRADRTFFGEKDYQQLTLVRRMAADLDLPVEVTAVATVREPDGLARSSRNRYLDPQQRAAASAIPRATAAGAAAGAGGAQAVAAATAAVLQAQDGLAIDYVSVHSPMLGEAPVDGPARLLVAVRVGPTRLIDNIPVMLGKGSTE